MKKIRHKVQVVVYSHPLKSFLFLRTNKKRGQFWQNITGGVKKNQESFLAGALREITEEINYKSNSEQLTDLDLDYQFLNRLQQPCLEKVYLLVVTKKWKLKIDSKEHDQFKWISHKKIENKISMIKHPSNQDAILKSYLLIGLSKF
jgi:8-oxo-dGTP pyrophosphatase MutT (NUDIX family)